MSNPIPEKLNNFAVYRDGEAVPLGLANVELPSLQALTEATGGAGISGQIENPVVGHYGSLVLKLSWRVVTENTTTLLAPMAHSLDIRAAEQNYDAAGGKFGFKGLRIVAKGTPKTTSLGTLDVGKMMNSSTEFELSYLKVSLDGKTVVEIDKYNFICNVHEVDYMSEVRDILGVGL